MSAERQPPATASAAPKKGLGMIVTLVAVAAISGILIVVVFQLTLPTITEKKAAALREAVFEVIPSAVRVVAFEVDGDALAPVPDGESRGPRVYAGYGGSGELMGVAIEAQGKGYQDTIKVIYGYSPQRQSIVGMRVLESKETPGLGDKIGKDPAFLKIFTDLDVQFDDSGKPRHEITIVKSGKRTQRWQIDAITGATISSKAIGAILSKSVKRHIPRVRKNLARLEKGQ